uniref:AAA+ ATPase domain-containing protein n=1 Tax=viral metagenome TaxID=1070528 RepID=A0A6C0B341_9ZZZZ
MNDTLSPEQNFAFEKFKRNENLFITGPGGTGKTKLIKHLVQYAKEINRRLQVCALTGCAAVLLNCNARTIHSWSGIKLAKGDRDRIVESVVKNKRSVKTWKSVDVLIIDEISMMSKKIFNILDEVGKRARNSSQPFGGIQMIFTGDFFQLPPVGNEDDEDSDKFCFESSLWIQTFKSENHIQLTTIFRQKDPLFVDMLSQIRKGKLNKDCIEILRKHLNRPYDTTGLVPTKLFPIRSKVDYVNSMMFSKIDEDEYEFEHSVLDNCKTYSDSGKAIPADILLKCMRITQQEKEYEIENILNNSPCSRILRLKKGASVLCTVNIDMENEICNGSQGLILDIYDKDTSTIVVVKFSNGHVKHIGPHLWQSEEFPSIAIKQYPLCLAWALTIHKIQGATLALAEVDIGDSVFEYGQTYVALSRVQSLDGLYLSAFKPERIRANPKVLAFYDSIMPLDLSITLDPINFAGFELKEENPDIKVVRL